MDTPWLEIVAEPGASSCQRPQWAFADNPELGSYFMAAQVQLSERRDGGSTMQALDEFVGGRLDEDESIAQDAIDGHAPGFRWGRDDTADARQAARWNPWRVLGSCVGKRLMVSAHHDVGPGIAHLPGEKEVQLAHTCATCGHSQDAVAWPCQTLRLLALDWVEHHDYQSQWRPKRRGCA